MKQIIIYNLHFFAEDDDYLPGEIMILNLRENVQMTKKQIALLIATDYYNEMGWAEDDDAMTPKEIADTMEFYILDKPNPWTPAADEFKDAMEHA